MRMNKVVSVAGLSTLCGALLLGRAGAQEATAPQAGATLEEIVVTAEKRESTVQETPISMTAISGDQIGRAHV